MYLAKTRAFPTFLRAQHVMWRRWRWWRRILECQGLGWHYVVLVVLDAEDVVTASMDCDVYNSSFMSEDNDKWERCDTYCALFRSGLCE